MIDWIATFPHKSRFQSWEDYVPQLGHHFYWPVAKYAVCPVIGHKSVRKMNAHFCDRCGKNL